MELLSMDITNAVYLMAASRVTANSFSGLEELISRRENLVYSAVTLKTGSYYWCGTEEHTDTRLFDINGVQKQAQKTDLAFCGKTQLRCMTFDRPGKYSMKLFRNQKVIRTVDFYVDRKRNVIPTALCDRGSVTFAIMVPQTAQWMVERINLNLMDQSFTLVSANQGKYVYHRQLTMSWSVLIVPYGDPNPSASVIDEVGFANEALLLLQNDEACADVIVLDTITHNHGRYISFNTKKHLPSSSKEQSDLDSIQLAAVDKLKSIAANNMTAIGAADVKRPEKGDYKEFDHLILSYLALPSSFSSRKIYMQFSYLPESEIFTRDMARRYTEEILDEETRIHAVTSDSNSTNVYVSCSPFCAWNLTANIEDTYKEYPSLRKDIKVLAASEIVANGNEDLAEMRDEMETDCSPNVTSNKATLSHSVTFPVPVENSSGNSSPKNLSSSAPIHRSLSVSSI